MDGRSPWRSLAIGLAFLIMLWSSPALGSASTALRFQPASALVRPGQTARLEIWVDGVVSLGQIEFTASYNAASLEVLDADPGREGIQLEVGPVFSGGYVPHNRADDGILRLVAYRFPGQGPFSGEGVVAAVTFRVRPNTTPGSYPVRFDPLSVRLADPAGNPLPVEQVGEGTVRVPPLTTALRGWITREGTCYYGRTAVSVFFFSDGGSWPTSWARTCTDAAGNFRLSALEAGPIPDGVPPPGAPPGSPYEWALMRLAFPTYLSECHWVRLDQETVNVGWHTLEGGDVNGDGCINMYDIVRIILDFGQSVPAPCFVPYSPCPDSGAPGHMAPPTDINGDCRVNILDLTMAGENFGLCSNCR